MNRGSLCSPGVESNLRWKSLALGLHYALIHGNLLCICQPGHHTTGTDTQQTAISQVRPRTLHGCTTWSASASGFNATGEPYTGWHIKVNIILHKSNSRTVLEMIILDCWVNGGIYTNCFQNCLIAPSIESMYFHIFTRHPVPCRCQMPFLFWN